ALRGVLAIVDSIRSAEAALPSGVDVTHVGECYEAAAICVAEVTFHLQSAAHTLAGAVGETPAVERGPVQCPTHGHWYDPSLGESCLPCKLGAGGQMGTVSNHGYPADWPKCAAGCGLPALDGHATCGRVQCN